MLYIQCYTGVVTKQMEINYNIKQLKAEIKVIMHTKFFFLSDAMNFFFGVIRLTREKYKLNRCTGIEPSNHIETLWNASKKTFQLSSDG